MEFDTSDFRPLSGNWRVIRGMMMMMHYSRPLYRDDIPYQKAERIVSDLTRQFPGARVIFAGEEEGDRERDDFKSVVQSLFEGRAGETFIRGQCFDCGKPFPGRWPPEPVGDRMGWAMIVKDPATQIVGNTITASGNGDAFILCPSCHATEPGG